MHMLYHNKKERNKFIVKPMSSVENVDVNIYLDLIPSSLGGMRQTEYLVKGFNIR